jgi:hypothetical protein
MSEVTELYPAGIATVQPEPAVKLTYRLVDVSVTVIWQPTFALAGAVNPASKPVASATALKAARGRDELKMKGTCQYWDSYCNLATQTPTRAAFSLTAFCFSV